MRCGCLFFFLADSSEFAEVLDWVFLTRNDWGASRPCLFPPLAVKSEPPAVRVVVDSSLFGAAGPKPKNAPGAVRGLVLFNAPGAVRGLVLFDEGRASVPFLVRP